MIKITHVGLLFLSMLWIAACNQNKEKAMPVVEAEEDKPAFFPVTGYIKGQIAQMNTNPILYTTIKDKTDSAWVQKETYNTVFAHFLSPEIDSMQMAPLFAETKFADKTLGTFTFTYAPKNLLPKDFTLKRWDVYVDPKTNQVKNIFLEKQIADTTIQLIWNNNASCKIMYLLKGADGNPALAKEEYIRWDF